MVRHARIMRPLLLYPVGYLGPKVDLSFSALMSPLLETSASESGMLTPTEYGSPFSIRCAWLVAATLPWFGFYHPEMGKPYLLADFESH
jgi:hypothetical protein